MDSNDTTILALALGIPSAMFLSIAFLLVLRIQHRQLQARRIPNPTVPTNSPAPPSPVDPYYGIPLEQRPPKIVAPLPRRPIPLNEFDRISRSEEGSLQSIPPILPAPRPPTPPRRRTPFIIVSPTTSADDHPYAPRSPSPASTSITERMAGDLMWAMTYESPPLPPVTILGMPILQHPQPRSAQASSGIISPSPSVPISLPHATAHLSTEPLPQSHPTHSTEERPMSGIDQS